MKGRCLIRLLLLLILLCVSCPQQPEKKGLPEKVAREKPAPVKKEPPKIIHIAGETISVYPKMGKLTVRGRGGDVEIYATEKTIIHIGRDNSRLSDITAGDKVIVKYLEIDGKNIARNISIAGEAQAEVISPKAEIPSVKPSEIIIPDKPPEPPQKTWPSS